MKMTVGIATILKVVVDKLLYTTNSDGVVVEATLPFSFQYRLQRARTQLEREYIYVLRKRMELLKEMNLESAELTEDQITELNDKLKPFLAKEIEHEFIKCTPEDIHDIKTTGITPDEMDLFIFYMVEDGALEADLKDEIE